MKKPNTYELTANIPYQYNSFLILTAQVIWSYGRPCGIKVQRKSNGSILYEAKDDNSQNRFILPIVFGTSDTIEIWQNNSGPGEEAKHELSYSYMVC